jgi:hypothetical protein
MMVQYWLSMRSITEVIPTEKPSKVEDTGSAARIRPRAGVEHECDRKFRCCLILNFAVVIHHAIERAFALA